MLVSQNGRGELTIGDSHEYGDLIEPFDKTEIDEWILGYLKTFLDAPGLRIASRWHGTYAKHMTEPYVVIHPAHGGDGDHRCRRGRHDALVRIGRASGRAGAR